MIRSDVHEVIDFLNSLVELDRSAIAQLVNARVECNLDLAQHPTVQVGSYHGMEYSVGLLGILNGYFGAYDDGPRMGWGAIGAQFDDDRLIGFVLLENNSIDKHD